MMRPAATVTLLGGGPRREAADRDEAPGDDARTPMPADDEVPF